MNTRIETWPRGAWSRSLRFRLTIWYTGVLALILTGASLLAYLGARHALRAETDGFLAGEVRRITVLAAGRPTDVPDAADVASAVIAVSGASVARRGANLLTFDVVYARLVTPAGVTFASSPDLDRQPALASSLDPLLRNPPLGGSGFAFAGPSRERMMRVYTAPLRVGPVPGILQVAVPWGHSADLLERLGALLLLGIPVVLVSAALGGWVLVGRTLQPIGRIVTEADRLDPGAVPEALLPQASETDNEIGLLIGTLNRMTTRLHRAFETQRRFAEAQQRFAADASHELRTPLTILRGEIEVALSRPRAPEQYQQTLRSAVQEVARMTQIVEGLSFLARRDAGQMRGLSSRDEIDLAELCDQACEEFAARAFERGVALRCEPCPVPVQILGDPGQLQQLLRNLLDNALKYTPPGGCVTAGATGDADAALLTVQDTGIGIAEADLPHVFERFWRVDKSRSTEGSGLGLAICAEIAAAHGGTLEVSSEPGQGSCFRFRLPL